MRLSRENLTFRSDFVTFVAMNGESDEAHLSHALSWRRMGFGVGCVRRQGGGGEYL